MVPLLKPGLDLVDENESTSKHKLFGIFLTILTVFLGLVTNTILKKMELSPEDALFMTGILQVIVSLLVLWKKEISIWIWSVDSDQNIHIIRALLFSLSIFKGISGLTHFVAVSCMPLGDAITIINCTVLPTMILASIFLKERLRILSLIHISEPTRPY